MYNMTIPSRPAPPPPPPKPSLIVSRTHSTVNQSLNSPPSRYTPTTNWDDVAFDNYQPINNDNNHHQSSIYNTTNSLNKKIPPPRPPPPKICIKSLPALKKSNQPTSINILSNLFGTTSNSTTSTKRSRTPTKFSNISLGTGKSINNNNLGNGFQSVSSYNQSFPLVTQQQNTQSTTTELISFDSPPSSPTLTQKSNSDCVSIGSFSSDSNNYSPNNGHFSQAESGFEDDFNLDSRIASAGTTVNVNKLQNQIDPWDPFELKPEIKVKPKISQKPLIVSIGNSNNIAATTFYAYNNTKLTNDMNNQTTSSSSANGNAVIQMPTIIKPSFLTQKPKIQNNQNKIDNKKTSIATAPSSSYASLPMPKCPPPPAPIIVPEPLPFDDNLSDTFIEDSHGYALYDFDAVQDGDLNLRQNEKVYIYEQLNNEWFYGKNKRGCEGMFPINYIDVKVPIKNAGATSKNNSIKPTNLLNNTNNMNDNPMIKPSNNKYPKVKALYQFNAELAEDLSIKENDIITILYKINDEWLFGEIGKRQGQFPSNFIEYIPSNLPLKPS